MQIQKEEKIVKIIETTKGHILSPFSYPQTKIKTIIFNQILNPLTSIYQCKLPIDLQNINFHKQCPNSLQNTSIPWSSIQHQLREIMNRKCLSFEEILIFDNSEYNKKTPQIFDNFKIVKGFNYRININSHSLNEEQKALLTEEHVLKQIQMQFSLGNGMFKPGYIGLILLSQIENQIYKGVIKAYLSYSQKSSCPIIIDFSSIETSPYHLVLQNQCQSIQILQDIDKKLIQLEIFLKECKTQHPSSLKNIIIYNLPVILFLDKISLSWKNKYQNLIQNIITQYQVYLGFQILRYSFNKEKQGLNQIIQAIQKHPNSIIISSGIRFKTDLTVNSGQGFSLYYHQNRKQKIGFRQIYNMSSVQYLKLILQNDAFEVVTLKNIIRLFDWKQKKQEIIVQIFWKCDSCKNDFSQKIKAFGKFGKQFCSIKCLKAFNF